MRILLFLFAVFVISCLIFYFAFYKKVPYEVQIVNDTGLELTQAIAHFDFETNGISVGVGKSSPIYITKYQQTVWNFFGPGSLKILVKEYIDEDGQVMTNGIGNSIPRHRMSKDKLNIITFYGKPDEHGFDMRYRVKE